MLDVAMTVGAVRLAKPQSKCHHHKPPPIFYGPDALPVAQPCWSTDGKTFLQAGCASVIQSCHQSTEGIRISWC